MDEKISHEFRQSKHSKVDSTGNSIKYANLVMHFQRLGQGGLFNLMK